MPGSSSLNAALANDDPSPTVDVLIPHYNSVDALDLSLASIDAQDYAGHFRVVVVDDGSTPEMIARLRDLIDRRERPVVLLENGVNRGRPYTRNVLLDATESPYTAWLDAGDAWYPSKTAAQIAEARALGGPDSDTPFWVTCNFDWQWTGREATRRFQTVDQDQVMALLRGKDLRAYLWTLLGPTRTFRDVGWFDEKLPRLQDLDFFLRFLLKRGRLHLPDTAESLCVYHKSDIGRDAEQIRACHAYIFDKHRVLYTRYGPKFTRVQLYNMEIHAARFAASNGDGGRRATHLWRAFRHRPKQFVRRWRSGGLKAGKETHQHDG